MSINSAALAEMPQFGMVWPQCVVRAWEDSQFRDALKSDPVGTLLKAFQFIVPAGISLEIVDGEQESQSTSANTLRMVIPPAPDMDAREIAMASSHGKGQDSSRHFTFSTLCLC
jgi:ribosomally synthesized peptide (two-chain TOMM family)